MSSTFDAERFNGRNPRPSRKDVAANSTADAILLPGAQPRVISSAGAAMATIRVTAGRILMRVL